MSFYGHVKYTNDQIDYYTTSDSDIKRKIISDAFIFKFISYLYILFFTNWIWQVIDWQKEILLWIKDFL